MRSGFEQQCQVALWMLTLRRRVWDCRRAFDYLGLKSFLFFIKVFHAIRGHQSTLTLALLYIYTSMWDPHEHRLTLSSVLVNVPLRLQVEPFLSSPWNNLKMAWEEMHFTRHSFSLHICIIHNTIQEKGTRKILSSSCDA